MSGNAIPWIDLSAYGTKLSIVKLPSGSRILVLNDTEAAKQAAGVLGFQFHERSGFWVMHGSKFDPREFLRKLREAGFDKVTAARMNPSDIFIDLTKPARKQSEPAQGEQDQAADEERAAPTAVEAGEEQEKGREKKKAPSRLDAEDHDPQASENAMKVLLSQARYLGLNRLGQEVYDAPDGRFIRDKKKVVFESELKGRSPFLFLRAVDDASLAMCADGLVEEIVRGKVLRMEDLTRFTSAIYAEECAPESPAFAKAYVAVEGAMARWLAKKNGRSMRDLFSGAVRLHEGQAFFSTIAERQASVGMRPLPMPIAVAAQRVVGTENDVSDKKITVANLGSGNLMAHLPKGGSVRGFERREDLIPQARATVSAAGMRGDKLVSSEAPDWSADIAISNLSPFAGEILDQPFVADGLTVTRADMQEVLESISQRPADGRSIFIHSAGDNPDDEEEAEAVREWIARHYAIEGTADIDGSLHLGSPEAPALRMLVVGPRRPEPLPEAPEPALRKRDVHEYASLWTWTAEVVTNRAKIADYHSTLEAAAADEDAEADPDLQQNGFQTPYVPASRLGTASTMVPRNLEGPTREALQRLARRHPDLDQWVANELAMTKEQLAEVLSPEQIDAMALQMGADERERAFLLADQTGIGKGRTLAAVMRRAALQGMNVIFVTERPTNLSDIWRDIRHIRSENEFSPFIMNDGVSIIDEMTGNELMRSQPRREIQEILQTEEWPEQYNLLLCTYSQFNKAPDKSPKSQWLRRVADENTLVIFDESHNASSNASNTSYNMTAAADNAGSVVYSSATFAKNAKNMAFYARLFPDDMDSEELTQIIRKGGETMQEVVSTMLAKDGVVIRREHDLSKCEFVSVSDAQSAERNKEYMDRLAPVLSEMAYLSGDIQRRVNYRNRQAEHLRLVAQNAAENRRARSLAVNRIGFGSPLYNLSRLFLAALKIDKVAEEAIEALGNNEKPVILVENTVQAVLAELVTDDDEGVVPDFKNLMHRALTQLTTVRRRDDDAEAAGILEEVPGVEWRCSLTESLFEKLPAELLYADESEKPFEGDFKEILRAELASLVTAARRGRRLSEEQQQGLNDASQLVRRQIEDLPETPQEAAPALRGLLEQLPATPNRAIRRIRAMIDQLPDLPISAIDEVRDRIEAAGYSCGEITGRSLECREGRVVRRRQVDKTVIKNGFNSGDLDALIINTAGATGVDLHAGSRFVDQRKRVMIELQSPADITKQIQAYGRVNRYDQVVGPKIMSVLSGLPMEMRLDAMRNAKLRRMSANVTSNRDNAALIDDIPDLINSVGDLVCTRYGEARPDLLRRLGYDLAQIERQERENEEGEAYNEDATDTKRSANTFLARLIMLPVAMQDQISNELIAEYEATIEEMDALGVNPLKAKELQGIVHVGDSHVFEGAEVDNPTSVFHEPVFVTEATMEMTDEPIRADGLGQQMERGLMAMGAETPQVFAERLRRNRERLLTPFLPDGLLTVQAALDNENAYMVNAAARLDRLIETLDRINIGSELMMSDIDGEPLSGIVTGLNTPRRGYEHLAAQYEVEFVVPGSSRPSRMKLQTLMRDEHFALHPGLDGEDYDAILERFDNALEGSRNQRLEILTGNLFKAMELNVQQGAERNRIGTLNVYQTSEGQRSRGLVVSRRFGGLDFLPVRLNSAELAHDGLVHQKMDLRIDNELASQHVMLKHERDGRLFAWLPNRRSRKFGYIYDNPVLAALADRYDGDGRRNPRVQVSRAELLNVVRAFYDVGIRFYTSGRNRPWVNQWLTQRYGEAHTEDLEQPQPDPAADQARNAA